MKSDKLREQVLGACFEVSNELGIGFLESVYEKALVIALQDRGLNTSRQVPIEVSFRGKDVGEFLADIIVEEELIVELKAVKSYCPGAYCANIELFKSNRKENSSAREFW